MIVDVKTLAVLAILFSSTCNAAFENINGGDYPRTSDMGQYAEVMNHSDRYGSVPTDAAAQVESDANKAWGNSYIDAKNGVNQPTNQPVSGYGSAYLDAKNSQSGFGSTYLDAKNNQTGYIKNDPTGKPVNIVSMTGINPSQPSINVAVNTLSPSTRVLTPHGVVTAGSLPANTQVTVAFKSAFSTTPKNGHAHSAHDSGGEHGTGNGANNAAGTHSAHGLGGNSHIGGGLSGGGFHY
ncbi:hypothetical protein MUU46_15245 [Scandinavium sp. TWS1a]|uniref:hypothetical protein n=1 Tax=Scandinavium tedordense TaxID=2926521 RepID=UPI00216556D9|nr:hypothetical protein [Scandinavium tedordense]MCS2171663.1 hypothetical protein [Scandinavium tedordense]